MKLADTSEASELARVLADSRYALVRGASSCVSVQLLDDDRSTSVRVPPSMALEVLGAIYGIAIARLLRLGIEVPTISDQPCIECNGSGQERRR